MSTYLDNHSCKYESNLSVPAVVTPTTANDPSTAPIIVILEGIFKELDGKFFDSALSKTAVITLSQKGTRAASGWCSKERVWEDGRKEMFYEVNICPEELNKPMEEVVGIVLHEMVHLWCAIQKISDHSRGSQYHNAKYRDEAKAHGLDVKKSANNGYSETSLGPEALEFAKSLDLSAFGLFRHDGLTDNKANQQKKKSSSRKYVCPGCENSFRATKQLNVRCEDCDERFKEEE